LLRKEWEIYLDKHYSDKEWCDIQIKYLQETEFLTRYAFQKYQEQKDRNLKLFKERSIELERETIKITQQSKAYVIQLSNTLLNAAGFILLGLVIGISLSLTVWGNFGYSWGIGTLSGFLIGLALRLGDQPFERLIIRKFSFPVALFIGTFTLIALFKMAQYSGMLIYDLLVAEMNFSEITESRIFKDIISTQGIMNMLWSAFLISIILNIIKLTSRIIGPRLMMNYVLGMYHKPIEEERIFMFIDINSSTSLAEKMGTKKYHELLNQFFYDIGEPISKSKGEIYQYVGDEVVVTWKMKDGLKNANCIRCYFRIEKQMEKLRPEYIKKFGFCPEFKVGMHGGKVITGEVGRTKTEIVFHGDVINTTERILNQCINLGKRMLISENLLRRLDLLPTIHAEYVTTRLFKGKENEVSLYTLIKE
jgi:adenylate cyclase